MRYIFYFLILIFLISCKKDNPINYNGNNCIDNNQDFKPVDISDNDYYELLFYNNSNIKLNENSELGPKIIPGKNIVFKYYSYNSDTTQPDSGIGESIIFEIENNLENFILSDGNLEKASAKYIRTCFCPTINYRVNDGCIKGQKQSNDEWQIDINVTVIAENTKIIMISELFTKTDK